MRLGYLMPLTVDNILTARKLSYDALEANVGWITDSSMAALQQDLPAMKEALARERISITAIAIYGDAIAVPANEAVACYGRAMDLARELNCGVVAGMTGRDNALPVDDNLALFKDRFEPIAAMASDKGMRVAFEPWPGHVTGYGPYTWANMAVSPWLYDRLFEAVPNPALGIEYDPSHFVWQGIDYLQVFRDYASRIHHMHAKDILIDVAALRRQGVHGPDWWRFTLPGLGQIDWPKLLRTAQAAGYTGDIAVEHEDRTYYGDRWNEGLTLGLKMLRPLIEEIWPS